MYYYINSNNLINFIRFLEDRLPVVEDYGRLCWGSDGYLYGKFLDAPNYGMIRFVTGEVFFLIGEDVLFLHNVDANTPIPRCYKRFNWGNKILVTDEQIEKWKIKIKVWTVFG